MFVTCYQGLSHFRLLVMRAQRAQESLTCFCRPIHERLWRVFWYLKHAIVMHMWRMKDVHRWTHLRLTAMPAINYTYTHKVYYIYIYIAVIVEDLNRSLSGMKHGQILSLFMRHFTRSLWPTLLEAKRWVFFRQVVTSDDWLVKPGHDTAEQNAMSLVGLSWSLLNATCGRYQNTLFLIVYLVVT